MADFWNTVAESRQHHVIDDGRLPALGLFAGFLVAFVVVRSIVSLIRDRQEEGRLSVGAALLAVGVAALAVIGAPFAVAVYQKSVMPASAGLGATHLVVALFAALAYLKGKRATAIVGLLILPAAVVGAVRLARPGSRGTKRFYDAEKSARVAARVARDHLRPHGLGAFARRIASDPLERAATLPDD